MYLNFIEFWWNIQVWRLIVLELTLRVVTKYRLWDSDAIMGRSSGRLLGPIRGSILCFSNLPLYTESFWQPLAQRYVRVIEWNPGENISSNRWYNVAWLGNSESLSYPYIRVLYFTNHISVSFTRETCQYSVLIGAFSDIIHLMNAQLNVWMA
jgi:hypothetical protein